MPLTGTSWPARWDRTAQARGPWEGVAGPPRGWRSAVHPPVSYLRAADTEVSKHELNWSHNEPSSSTSCLFYPFSCVWASGKGAWEPGSESGLAGVKFMRRRAVNSRVGTAAGPERG